MNKNVTSHATNHATSHVINHVINHAINHVINHVTSHVIKHKLAKLKQNVLTTTKVVNINMEQKNKLCIALNNSLFNVLYLKRIHSAFFIK